MKEKSTELKTLENRRLLFTNYSEIAELKAQLEEYQYNEEAMKVGKALYDKARQFGKNKPNGREKSLV